MGRAIVRPAARRDLIRHFAYIGENSSLDAARRFLSEARGTFLELAQTTHLGARRQSQKVPTLRMWRVRHFEKYLIFYHPSPTASGSNALFMPPRTIPASYRHRRPLRDTHKTPDPRESSTVTYSNLSPPASH